MNDDCATCKHSRFDHIDWKAGTKYANDNTYCRIVRCGCCCFVALIKLAVDFGFDDD